MSLKIITNNQPREILSWYDLTEKEQKEFDYLDTDEKQGFANFVRYHNWVYDIGEFMSASHDEFKIWDGYSSDTYFSGILIRYVDDNERVIMGRYYS